MKYQHTITSCVCVLVIFAGFAHAAESEIKLRKERNMQDALIEKFRSAFSVVTVTEKKLFVSI